MHDVIVAILILFFVCVSEYSHRAEKLGEELKEERGILKLVRSENMQVKEELSDLRNEKEAIDRVSLEGRG